MGSCPKAGPINRKATRTKTQGFDRLFCFIKDIYDWEYLKRWPYKLRINGGRLEEVRHASKLAVLLVPRSQLLASQCSIGRIIQKLQDKWCWMRPIRSCLIVYLEAAQVLMDLLHELDWICLRKLESRLSSPKIWPHIFSKNIQPIIVYQVIVPVRGNDSQILTRYCWLKLNGLVLHQGYITTHLLQLLLVGSALLLRRCPRWRLSWCIFGGQRSLSAFRLRLERCE